MECSLDRKKCKPCEGGVPPLGDVEISGLLGSLEGWERAGNAIRKTYSFTNYYETMAFVNMTAWVSHKEDHHPDIHVGYNQCQIEYFTHAIGGLSENDFICAAKIDTLRSI